MKSCFKCGAVKPLAEFYHNRGMADGYLGKCIPCTKLDEKNRRLTKLKDPLWVDRERERNRNKMSFLRSLGLEKKPTKESKSQINRRYSDRHPQKKKAHAAINNGIRAGTIKRQPCQVCHSANAQAHHDDYSKPLDVMWLCPKHHAERHVQLRRMALFAEVKCA